jgi:hypothetical protein
MDSIALWEVYELAALATGFGGGYIQTEPMDLTISLCLLSLASLYETLTIISLTRS